MDISKRVFQKLKKYISKRIFLKSMGRDNFIPKGDWKVRKCILGRAFHNFFIPKSIF